MFTELLSKVDDSLGMRPGVLMFADPALEVRRFGNGLLTRDAFKLVVTINASYHEYDICREDLWSSDNLNNQEVLEFMRYWLRDDSFSDFASQLEYALNLSGIRYA
jgi:hypothetical protein